MKTNRRWMLLSFFLPFLACLGICMGTGVYPFGSNCILHIDMFHQYCPFFTELLNKLQNGGSLQYTWNLGLGSDFVALYAYYLASPLNWLLVLWPKAYIIEFMTLAILIKIGASGWSFFLYLRESYCMVGKDGTMHRNTAFPALVFSTAYALSGFVAAYSWDIMWMDNVALAPLILLGLEKLVKEKKVVLYYAALSVSILSNYYISIMICIFLVLYFVVLWIEQKEGRWKALGRFSLYSLLAGGTGAVLLIPEMLALGYAESSGAQFPEKVEWYFSLLAEFSRSCTVTDPYTGGDHWPNLYAGAFCILLLFLYIFNTRIRWKHKLPRLILIAFFLVSFANNYLDFIWHGLHFPNSLPGRQSFLYIFLILVIGFETIRMQKGIRYWHLAAALVLSLVILLGGALTTDESVTEPLSFFITGAFIICYVLLFVLIKISGKGRKQLMRQYLFGLAIAELIINMAITGFYTTSRTAYRSKMEDYAALLEHTKEEDSFYRVEDPQRKTKNDNCLYGYPSVTEFSSLMNINVSHFYQSVYMEGGKNFYCYNGATPLTSAMFSVKYTFSDSPLEESPVRTLVATEGEQYLYENNYCLPFGYILPDEVVEEWDNSMKYQISQLNSLAGMLGAKENMLTSFTCDIDVKNGSTDIMPKEEGYYFAVYQQCSSDSLTEKVSSGRSKKFSKTTHRYLIDLGYCNSEDTITISNSKDEMITFTVYRLNLDSVAEACETLGRQTMTLEKFTDTKIEGGIDVTDDGWLMLTVPCESGWTLYVDGVETEITAFRDSFISVYLEEGTHQIRLSYQTPGLVAGGALSAFCICLFLLLHLVRRKWWKY